MGGSSRYPLYIDSQVVDNTTVKNAYISGWANYLHGSTTIWDAIYLTNNGQKIGSSLDLASAVYLCDINSLKNGEQLITFTRDEIVSDSSKGNASLINLSQTPGFKIGL